MNYEIVGPPMQNIQKLFSPLYILAFATLVFCFAFFPFQSEDLYMYLAIARTYLNTGHWPITDPFLFTLTDYKWQTLHEWAAYFVFYFLHQVGGLGLVTAFKAFIITACMSLPLVWTKRTHLKLFLWGLSVLVVVNMAHFRFAERTNLFSEILAVLVFCICLVENQKPSRLKYFLPMIFLFWVNLHPGFVLGWAILGLFAISHIKRYRESSYRHFFAMSALSFAICILNPTGLHGMFYPFIFAMNEGQVFQQYYFEWYPSTHQIFRSHPQIYLALALFILHFSLQLFKWHPKRLFVTLSLLLITFMAVRGIRFIPTLGYFLIASGCFWDGSYQLLGRKRPGLNLNTHFAGASPGDLHSSREGIKKEDLFKWLTPVMLVICLGFILKLYLYGYTSMGIPRKLGYGLDPIALPTKNLELIANAKFNANMYNSHRFGSYLAWKWNGQPKIFYHGFVTDTEFYINDYFGFTRSKADFERLVKKYQIKGFLVEFLASAKPMIEVLMKNPEWQLVGQDPASLLFIKKDILQLK